MYLKLRMRMNTAWFAMADAGHKEAASKMERRWAAWWMRGVVVAV